MKYVTLEKYQYNDRSNQNKRNVRRKCECYEEKKCKNQSLIVLYRLLAVFSRHKQKQGLSNVGAKKSFPLLLLVVSLPHLPSDLKLRFHSIILRMNQNLFCRLYVEV